MAETCLIMTICNMIKCLMAILYFPWIRICRGNSCGVVLYYHGVPPEYTDEFEKQIAYLSEMYTIVSPTSMLSPLRVEVGRGKRAVAITFDDAFENVLRNAVPILQNYQVPAAICVPTGYMGQAAAWEMSSDCGDINESVMTREQVSLLDQQGFEVYSHTVSHCQLATLGEEAIQHELEVSKATLEDIVGHDVVSISYPHGSVDARVLRAARTAGYHYGFTIEPSVVRQESELLRCGRVSVALSDPMFVFRLKAAGAFQVEVYLRRLKKAICAALQWKRHLQDIL